MEGRCHYPCQVGLNGIVVFVIWYSSERDGFVRDDHGRLLAASTLEGLTAAAGARNTDLVSNGSTEYDFDRIRSWCDAPDGAEIDCSAFLNAWNFFDDLAGLSEGNDTPFTRLSREAIACYDKLFWGNNLPSVTPPGEWFEPVWRVDELTKIRQVMEAGLAVWESELYLVNLHA